MTFLWNFQTTVLITFHSIAGICLRTGLYVTRNGTPSFLCLMVSCGALCVGIYNTLLISVVGDLRGKVSR